jgi:hypothetical protein
MEIKELVELASPFKKLGVLNVAVVDSMPNGFDIVMMNTKSTVGISFKDGKKTLFECGYMNDTIMKVVDEQFKINIRKEFLKNELMFANRSKVGDNNIEDFDKGGG